MAKDPYKNSPYDASGMPLTTTFVDCDNAEEVRKNMVKDKVVEPQNHVYDLDYETKSPKEDEYKSDVQLNEEKGINQYELNIPGIDSDVNRVDIEDAGVKRALFVDEAEKKGFTEVQELPKVEDNDNVHSVRNNENFDDILAPVLKASNPPEDKEDNDGKV